MQQNRNVLLILISLTVFFLAGCARKNTVCPPVAETQPALRLTDLVQTTKPVTPSGPAEVEVQGRMMRVDRVVDYPVCNDDWSGVVYVSCSARVAEAELDADANPLFFKGCSLNIAPNTIVYVAAHNDAAYYKGCSCHSGEAPLP